MRGFLPGQIDGAHTAEKLPAPCLHRGFISNCTDPIYTGVFRRF